MPTLPPSPTPVRTTRLPNSCPGEPEPARAPAHGWPQQEAQRIASLEDAWLYCSPYPYTELPPWYPVVFYPAGLPGYGGCSRRCARPSYQVTKKILEKIERGERLSTENILLLCLDIRYRELREVGNEVKELRRELATAIAETNRRIDSIHLELSKKMDEANKRIGKLYEVLLRKGWQSGPQRAALMRSCPL